MEACATVPRKAMTTPAGDSGFGWDVPTGERTSARGAIERTHPCRISHGQLVTVIWHGKPVLIRTGDTLAV